MSNASGFWHRGLLDWKVAYNFNEVGRRGEWDPRLLLGNPATDLSLKQYLKCVTAEQLQAQATPKQATPSFVNDLLQLSHLIDRKLRSEDLTPITCLFY